MNDACRACDLALDGGDEQGRAAVVRAQGPGSRWLGQLHQRRIARSKAPSRIPHDRLDAERAWSSPSLRGADLTESSHRFVIVVS